MKRTTILATLMFAAATTFVACQKDQPIVQANSLATQTGALTGACLPGNATNPMEQAGIKHNVYLAAGINAVGTLTATNYPQAFAAIDARAAQDGPINPSPTSAIYERVTRLPQTGFGPLMPTNQVVSDRITSFVGSIIDDGEPTRTYCQIKTSILQWETELTGDATLTTANKNTLLGFSSVLRHSLAFWTDRYDTNTQVCGKLSTVAAIVDGVTFASHFDGTAGGIVTAATEAAKASEATDKIINDIRAAWDKFKEWFN